MREIRVAERYANGFVSNFTERTYSELLSEIRGMRSILADNPEMMMLLASSVVTFKDKQTLFEPFIKESNYGEYWQNLVLVLDSKDRLNIFDLVLDVSERLILAEMNIVKMTIKTAHEVTAETRDKIIAYVSNKLGKALETTFILDSTVLGGFVAESDNFIIDSSVKHSLEKFRLSLLNL